MSTVVYHGHSKIADGLALPAGVLSCLIVGATVSLGPFLPNLAHQLLTAL